MSELAIKCGKCEQTIPGACWWEWKGKWLCYACYEGIMRDLEAEAAHQHELTRQAEAEAVAKGEEVERLRTAIRRHREAYLAAGSIPESCSTDFDKELWQAAGKEA